MGWVLLVCPAAADDRSHDNLAHKVKIRDVASVEVETYHKTSLVLLHDPGHSLDERILREQFRY